MTRAALSFDPVSLVGLGYQHHEGHTDWARKMIGPLCGPLNLDGLSAHGFFLHDGLPQEHFGIDSDGSPIGGAEVSKIHAEALGSISPEQARSLWLAFSAPGVVATSDPTVHSFFPPTVQSRVLAKPASLIGTATSVGGGIGIALPMDARRLLVFSVIRLEAPEEIEGSRSLWRMLCIHLSAALRLSERPASLEGEDVECVLSADGRVLEARGAAGSSDARNLLGTAVRRVDRARTKAGRADPLEALSAWLGLFDGRWSLVDHVDTDGRRFVLARENAPDFWPIRTAGRLSKRQSQVLYCAAAGLSNQEIGYLLGMSSPTVATHLRRGLGVLGISKREDWLRMSGEVEALLRGGAPDALSTKELTDAERDIASMILDGASTERIAAERGTSVSTVSNQISTILAKLGLTNRQALVQYLARQ